MYIFNHIRQTRLRLSYPYLVCVDFVQSGLAQIKNLKYSKIQIIGKIQINILLSYIDKNLKYVSPKIPTTKLGSNR